MELRKDYLLNRWVVISESRNNRPFDFGTEPDIKRVFCVFCSGNESQTPKEIYQIEKDGKWKIRVIPNKFAAVDPMGTPTIATHNDFYTFAGDHGEHEVVIETPTHGKNFGDLEVEDIVSAFKTYNQRITELKKDPSVKYVCLFKNQGKNAGASINHPHSQIISFSMVPPEVMDKVNAVKKYPSCPYCEIINREKNSYRRCFENDSCVSFTPYASRFNYEIWIFPKNHITYFSQFDEKMYFDMASMLKTAVQKLEKENIDYDVAWYYSPEGENLHFHVEIMPRISLWAGFEMGFGVTINSVSPESAAKFYRGEK